MRQRSLIAIGGEGPERKLALPSYDKVIAADSGGDLTLEMGLEPDIVVGDLDSYSGLDELKSKVLFKAKEDKDESDFELALMSLGDNEYDLIGGGGGRMDHFVAIWSMFLKYRPPHYWFTAHDFLISFDELRIRLPLDTLLTVMTIKPGVASVVSDGLKWELNDFPLSYNAVSLSNRSSKAEVHIKSDTTLFMCLPLSIYEKGDFEVVKC